MQLSKNYKHLKASSLLESVIAISILSICTLVALSIYLNVSNKNKSIGYYNAKHKVEGLTKEAIINRNYENEIFTFKEFNIEKKVYINKDENLVSLIFSITSSEKTHTLKKMISYVTEDEN